MNPARPLPQIPIYLKTAADAPRPADPEFFWLTRRGMYLCRNHRFFSSDVPTCRMPRSLADHQPACRTRFPLLGTAALEYVVGFFDEAYLRYGAEAIVLVLWDTQRRRYRLCVPRQRASVWQSQGGLPCAIDVKYEVPSPLPPHHLLVGDIHSHADLSAYSSGTDNQDVLFRDGVHAVVGRIDKEPPDFHLEMTADSHSFSLRFGQFFKGYRRRRLGAPKAWMQQVEVTVARSSWTVAGKPDGHAGNAGGTLPLAYEQKSPKPIRDNEV